MLVYLDNNSTTPLAPEVISSVSESLRTDWANPSSDSRLGVTARHAIETARQRLATLVHAEEARDIVFTSGGTESNNTAIWSAVEEGRAHSERPHVVTSSVEHVATVEPLKYVKSRGLIADYTEVGVDQDGCLQAEAVMAAIRPDTVLVTVMMANNETGVIFPIAKIGRLLRELNKSRTHAVKFHVDAAQAIGKIPVDVQELGVDYLTVVGHKFHGPRIGALYVRQTSAGRVVSPVVRGGGQEGGLRPGTENTPMIVGLGVAAQLVTDNLHTYTAHLTHSRDYLLSKLQEKTDCVVNCAAAARLPNTLSVSWPRAGLTGYQLLSRCSQLVASTQAACHGQDCVSEVLLRSGVAEPVARATVRLSVGRETTTDEIDIAVDDLVKALS